MKLFSCMRPLALGLLGSACIPISGALAQETQTPQASGLEELVVTARKREETLKDIPISIDAFTGDDLFDTRQDNLDDLTKTISNVIFATDSPIRSRISIRGIGPDSTGTLGPGVGMFIDGAYQTRNAHLNIPFFDLERVEVLKGPQGTLYGRNTLAGVINFITPKPGADFNGKVGVEVGSDSTLSVGAAVGGTLVEDKLYGRISAQYREGDGTFTNQTLNEPAYPYETEQVRGRLVWEASENLEFDLAASYYKNDGNSFVYSQIANLDNLVDFHASEDPGETILEHSDLNLLVTYSFDNFDVKSRTSYFEDDWDVAVDADTGPLPILRSDNTVEITAFAQEIRFISTHDGPFQWLVGAEYSKTTDEQFIDVFGPLIDFGFANAGGPGIPINALYPTLPASGIGVATITEKDEEVWGAFVDVTYELNDRLELGFGLRYDDVQQDQELINGFTGPTRRMLLPPVTQSILPGIIPPFIGATLQPDTENDQDELQPKFTATMDWTEALTTYAAVSRGFRQGGFNETEFGGPLATWTGDTAWNYELGFRWSSDDGRANLSGALFYLDWEDATGAVLSSLGRTAILNLGDASSVGIELAGEYAVNDNLNLSFSAGVLDCKYDEVDPAAVFIFEDDQCVDSADWSFNVKADYRRPLGSTGFDLLASASVIGQGDTKVGLHIVDDPSRTTQEAYYLGNLSLGLQNDTYSFTLYADNITDEEYAVFVGTVETTRDAFGGMSDFAVLGPTRTYGLRMRMNF